MSAKLFDPYQIAWLRAFWPRYPRARTARMFNERFGTEFAEEQIFAAAKRYGCGPSAKDGRFRKGSVPPNKGRKGYAPPGCEKGWFRKGDTPANTLPLYAERMDERPGKTPVLMIKIPGGAPYPSQKRARAHQSTRWVRKAVWVWERHNGPVPPGRAVVQLDGDPANCDPANLDCVPRSVLARLNGPGSIPPAGREANACRVRAAQLRDRLSRRRRDAR